jgi:hypothetical protein
MKDLYYRVRLTDGTLSGLTSLVSAQMIADTRGGTVVVDSSEYFSQKGREYRGQYPTA